MSKTVEELVNKVYLAQQKYRQYTQEQIDKIVFTAAVAANRARITLAKSAVAETGMGVVEDKVIKNLFAAEYVYNKYRNEKTCGVVSHNNVYGIYKVADSIGVIAALIPCTNPTSTIIFKALLALKTGNGIVFSPHPRAKKCCFETVQIILNAAIEAGAPQDIIGCIPEPSRDYTNELLHNPQISLILATGGPEMVKAAYSSGKPAIGVGPGNTPVVIDETAEIKSTVSSILLSKTFDNGVICASEQSLVIVDSVYNQVKKELLEQGAYIVNAEEYTKLASFIVQNGALNPQVVGQKPSKIAELSGFQVPIETKVLIAEISKVGKDEPLSYEKLSPILGMYKTKNFEEATAIAEKLIEFGGMGHTSVLYTDETNNDRIKYYAEHVKTSRVLINTPSSQGAIGGLYNEFLEPSLTLGCGYYGGTSISENISVKHLLNSKTVAERHEHTLGFIIPKIYFGNGCIQAVLSDLKGFKRALIVADNKQLTHTVNISDILRNAGIQYELLVDDFHNINLDMIQRGFESAKSFKIDLIIASGSGSTIDAAKLIRFMHDHGQFSPENLEAMTMSFIDAGKRIYQVQPNTSNTTLIAIPTTSGSGGEVTPFAMFMSGTKDDKLKRHIFDGSLLPSIVILDPKLMCDTTHADLIAANGFDAITHAVESIASIVANDYTNALAFEALRSLVKYLPISYKEGSTNLSATGKVHYAANMAGIALANAFLGLTHSITHKLEAAFGLSHGVLNAIFLPHVIKFNATNHPSKMAVFPQYKTPQALERYAGIAINLGLAKPNSTQDELVIDLIKLLEDLRKNLSLPASIKECGITKEAYNAKIQECAELIFDDQCTATNPRYPLIEEIKIILQNAYDTPYNAT